MNMPEKAGLPHGALRSHSNTPLVKPLRRMAASTAPGTVKPWIIEAMTAKYMKYEVFSTFHSALMPGSDRRW